MKKSFFFILVIILIIITFYSYYYEKFSVKVQDAMIFKDYKDNIVGTYPDRNIYPDLFVKAKGEYVNMIGAFHGVSEIKMAKPKDGLKGPKGNTGPKGKTGPQGLRGKDGEELIEEDIVNNRNSTCIAPGGISVSRMCKGPDGNSPEKPADGTPGKMCPHDGGHKIIEDGVEIYYGGKCPNGPAGPAGKTCYEKIGSHKCPPGQRGNDGLTCAQVNSNLTIINNKCPDGDRGPDGKTCFEEYGFVDGKCPIPADGNPGQTCYKRFGPLTPGGLPNCSSSQPGVDSVDCMDPNNPNKKYCGRVNPKIVQDTANDLTINKFNGNELTIDNNKEIQLTGNIIIPNDGKIILRNQDGSILKEINKQYIDNMILKSKQCKKCPSDHWNNSNNCEKDQGTCIPCSECSNGYRTDTPCSEHNDAVFVQCSAGYVGKECHTKCDPEKGQYPNSNKTECNTILSSQYITNDYQIHNIPSGHYRNPNDATNIIICPIGHYCIDGVKKLCPGGKFQTSTGQSECENCTSNCGDGYYREGSCTSTSNYSCDKCPKGHYCKNGVKNKCSDYKEYQDETGQSTCKKCTEDITITNTGYFSYNDLESVNEWDIYGKNSSKNKKFRFTNVDGRIRSSKSHGPDPTFRENKIEWQNPDNSVWTYKIVKNPKSYGYATTTPNANVGCNNCTNDTWMTSWGCTHKGTYEVHRLWL